VLAKHKASGHVVAIKMIEKIKVREAEVYQELMHNELLMLEKTDHPHITRVLELMEDRQRYLIVMEYLVGGNLLERVLKNAKEGKSFTETQAAKILYQVMLALNYMHL
jgi:serine/threonine protein kinase